MKICKKCGAVNKDENNFCNCCGAPEFSEAPADMQTPQPAMPVPPAPAPMPAFYNKPDFTWYDVMTIFSFVASIIGCFVIGLILDPLALAAGIAGFAKGKRNRALAIAAIVIAAIFLLIRLFITLHDNGIIPEWVITGAFDS